MFADELKGNTGRKRAEENKARRQRLKEEQERKKKAQDNAAAASHGISNHTSSSIASATILTAAAPSVSLPSLSLSSTTRRAGTEELSAVERAQQERRIRQQVALQVASATRIQACYRCHKHAASLQTTIQQQLAGRLSDLATLRSIIQTTKKIPYVPPPATTRLLCTQLIFVTTVQRRSLPRLELRNNETLGFLQLLLEYALLPGLESGDASLDPLLTWIDAPEGRFRLKSLVRLCFLALNEPSCHCAISVLSRLLAFDESTAKHRSPVVDYCRSLLLSIRGPPALSPQKRFPPFALSNTSLDIISILRYHLMYQVSSSPIPDTASELREQCIGMHRRKRAGEYLIMVLKVIESTKSAIDRTLLRIRFVIEILTVPLLVWKISPEATTALITSDATSASPLVSCLQALVEVHAQVLAAGKLSELLSLQEAPLSICPATSSQSLLANLVQLVQMNSAMNGTQQIHFETATLYFNVIATLVDVVPLGTFSSRDSTVEWISDGAHHTPVVLSSIILEQCKLLLVDSFVRRLFQQAIDMNALQTDSILSRKEDQDLKHENDLLQEGGAISAAMMAAKEARIDRNRSFWISSRWSKKLTKGVTSFLSGDSNNKSNRDGKGTLMNTSSIAMKLAGGKHDPVVVEAALSNDSKAVSSIGLQKQYDTKLLVALCRTYATVLARWGGGGLDDIVEMKQGQKSLATSKPEACVLSLLNLLCFSTNIIKASWGIIQSDQQVVSELYGIIDADRGCPPVKTISIRPSYASQSSRNAPEGDGAALLYVFVCSLAHALIVSDDVELYDMDRPLPLHQLRRCIQVLKKLLYRACCLDDKSASFAPNYFGLSLISASSRTMRDLYDRSSRRPLCIPKLWLVPDLLEKEIRQCKTNADYVALLSFPVLRICPQLVSFKRRLKLFERIVVTNRVSIQGVNDGNPFNTNPLKPGIPVFITRGRLLEDGLATMNNLGSRMRQRISVQYVNEAGTREAGVDAGGLFKEFWTDLCAIAFDLNYALFRITEGTNCLYPNPSSGAAHGSDHIQLFEFLGRILGKALFEGITIQPKFAHFFLSFLRGDYNYLHMLPDLSTLDPQLYNNLMFLKTFDGDAADLCLSFTVTNDEFGGNTEIPLIPNGSEVDVTNANKHRYIGLVAKYFVVDRVKEQSEAFTRGLWEVIDRSWLRIFNEPELQVLISGPSDGKIDVDDMRANTRYVGGYTGLDRNVNRFWSVIKTFSSTEQAELLRFVTSCERPPPLGFASMNPPFTIQRVSILRDDDKLPSASTCFNTLKLPTYSSEKVLKERLLYAIKSGAGFELT